MNRHTRVALISMVIVLLWALIWSATGSAQENSKFAQLLKLYRECVFEFVSSQVESSRIPPNGSAATELAFQACRTEEQAILAYASAGGVTAAQANQAVTDLKLNLKQTIRKILATPERYAPKAPVRQTAPAPETVLPPMDPPRPGCRSTYRRYDGATVSIDCN
jgi:hypothetical protein